MGVLIFLFLLGIKPKPLTPILHPSCILTLLEIKEFLIVTNDPIIQFSPILTLLSIILLLPISEFFPIITFFPINTLFPNLILGYELSKLI